MAVFLLEHGDRKLYSSASSMFLLLLFPALVTGSLKDCLNPVSQVDVPDGGRLPQEAPLEATDGTDDDLERMRQEEWAHVELTYGLSRPGPNERVIYVHRRFAIAPHTWDPIPVSHNWVPGEILEDIARWYNDIFDRWEDISWWLCRVHSSSMALLASANYVLVHENDFLLADQRPHGLIELVFSENKFLFPTFLPKWINWPILQAFLEPMSPSTHFGITMYGLCDGARLDHRLHGGMCQWLLHPSPLRIYAFPFERIV